MSYLRAGLRAARAVLRGWRRFYGENPLHLLAMIGCFALAGYVVSMVYTDPSAYGLLVWFLGAVIGHDLVMYPLYALADQPLVVTRWARRKLLPPHPPRVPAINHLRVPTLGSAVLLLIYLPTITQHSADAFLFAAGHPMAGQYQNWLLITAILFLTSAVLYALRLGTSLGRTAARRLRRSATPGAPPTAPHVTVPEPHNDDETGAT